MLNVENLCKKYEKFELKNISFHLPKGYITGFIGANGAGKTTTLKSVLNIVHPDGGEVTFCGKNMRTHEVEIKSEIGFMLGPIDFYPRCTVKKIVGVYKRFFEKWSDETYKKYSEKFSLDETKKIRELSTGMKVKLGITLALSHDAKLMIFDEPTSGLDPVARDELLDIFREIVEDGEKSILFSTHITSDLDKCADYIIFIRNGEIVLDSEKDEIADTHAIITGTKDALTDSLRSRVIGYKENSFNFSALIKKSDLSADDDVKIERPDLEDIMIYYNKEKTL